MKKNIFNLYIFKETFKKQKIYELLPRRLDLFAEVCREVSPVYAVCVEALNFFMGYDDKFNKVSGLIY